MIETSAGQVWRRRSTGATYRVVDGGVDRVLDAFGWVNLRNTKTGRLHTVSASGLEAKYELIDATE